MRRWRAPAPAQRATAWQVATWARSAAAAAAAAVTAAALQRNCLDGQGWVKRLDVGSLRGRPAYAGYRTDPAAPAAAVAAAAAVAQ